MSRDTKTFCLLFLASFVYSSLVYILTTRESGWTSWLQMLSAGLLMGILLAAIIQGIYALFIEWLKSPILFFVFTWLIALSGLIEIANDVGNLQCPYISIAGLETPCELPWQITLLINPFFYLALFATLIVYKQKILPYLQNRKTKSS